MLELLHFIFQNVFFRFLSFPSFISARISVFLSTGSSENSNFWPSITLILKIGFTYLFISDFALKNPYYPHTMIIRLKVFQSNYLFV